MASGFGPWRRVLVGMPAALVLLASGLVVTGCGDGGASDDETATGAETGSAEATATEELTLSVAVATVVVGGAGADGAATPESSIVQWTSTQFGVQFNFDMGADPFLLSEVTNPEPGLLHVWSLVRRSELEATQPNAFGPRGMVIELFEFAPGSAPESAEAWVRGNGRSNLGMGSGELKPRTVGGVEGVRYSWSGLYEAVSVAVLVDERLWLFTMLFREDISELGAEFGALLDSVVFAD